MKRKHLVCSLERKVLNGCCLKAAVDELDLLTHRFVNDLNDDEIDESFETFQKYINYMNENISNEFISLFRFAYDTYNSPDSSPTVSSEIRRH